MKNGNIQLEAGNLWLARVVNSREGNAASGSCQLSINWLAAFLVNFVLFVFNLDSHHNDQQQTINCVSCNTGITLNSISHPIEVLFCSALLQLLSSLAFFLSFFKQLIGSQP